MDHGDSRANGDSNTPNGRKNEPPIRPLHMLIADDSLESRMLVEIILRNAGCDVTVCTNGAEALKLAESQKFDMLLLDIQMPVMNGLDAVKKIRAGLMNALVPIVALTAGTEKADEIKCFEAGYDDYITKPVNKETLLQKIDKYVQKVVADGKTKGLLIESDRRDNPDYKKAIEMFLENLPERIDDMRKAFDDGNLQEFAMKVHSLKGIGGFVGFQVYTEKAKEIETMVSAKEFGKIGSQLDELLELCKRTRSKSK